MRGYKPVSRCKDCGKIYDKGIPYICSKCGAEIGKPERFMRCLGYEKAVNAERKDNDR